MTTFTIKHEITGRVMFSLETEALILAVEAGVKAETNLRGANLMAANLSGANLSGANLRGANLMGANLMGANLMAANLRGANLSGANLRGADLMAADLRVANLRGADLMAADLRAANLRGANLSGANLRGTIKITRIPIQIYGSNWDITIWDEHMQIGCEFHPLTDWFGFDDRRIGEMAGKTAVEFWQKWKGPLLQICIDDNRYKPTEVEK